MTIDMQDYLKKISTRIFSELQNQEEMSLQLHSEESDFVRFNQSLVRQNTTVSQHELTFVFQIGLRCYKKTQSLTLDLQTDLQTLLNQLPLLRQQLALIDENPKVIPLINHGTSAIYKKSQRPSTDEIIKIITQAFNQTDLVGFWCSGPLRQASINSKGQFHYFENDSFFFDYSVYNGPRAAKGFYSESDWNEKNFLAQAHKTINKLALLSRPLVKVQPKALRAYLEPMAVAEIMGIFNWKALSRNAYEQGYAPLKKLVQKEKSFSRHFSLIENNDLGLDAHFNSIGEIPAAQTTLIEKGEFKTLLISSATAQEYNLISNQADSSEAMRTMEVRAGTLTSEKVLNELKDGLYLSNLHYINWSDVQAARITGMTRFACFWVENSEIVGPIQDLRFDDSLFNLFGDQLLGLTSERETMTSTSTYSRRQSGGLKVPGALLNQFNFTL